MPKHPKRPRDPAQLAKFVIDIATGDAQDTSQKSLDGRAVDFPRQGGLKGGIARAEKLSGEQRTKIAKAGAEARRGRKTREHA
jgi:hypothetical protein